MLFTYASLTVGRPKKVACPLFFPKDQNGHFSSGFYTITGASVVGLALTFWREKMRSRTAACVYVAVVIHEFCWVAPPLRDEIRLDKV